MVLQVLFCTADGKEYRESANANERVHQQTEGHRSGRDSAPDDLQELRKRAIALYVRHLTDPKTDWRLRVAAINLGADAVVHSHPEIRPALQKAKPEYVQANVPEVAAMSPEWKPTSNISGSG